MMVLCYANAIIVYDRRRSGLPSASRYGIWQQHNRGITISHIHVLTYISAISPNDFPKPIVSPSIIKLSPSSLIFAWQLPDSTT